MHQVVVEAGPRKRGKYKSGYSESDMTAAVADVVAGEKLDAAASRHGVPYSTLQNRAVRAVNGQSARRAGRSTTLTFAQEMVLVAWCCYVSLWLSALEEGHLQQSS